MKINRKVARKVAITVYECLNKLLPKYNRVLILGFPNVESSAVEVANYFARHHHIPVTYVISTTMTDNPKEVLLASVRILNRSGSPIDRFRFFIGILLSKYIFVTHGIFFDSFSKRQKIVNLWHGILYKRLGLLIGAKPTPADITVGTSKLTQKMFSEAFGVSKESVFISGYPRNDALITSTENKTFIKYRIKENLDSFAKIIMWLPTFRKHNYEADWFDGEEVGNPFYIEGFNVEYFNSYLKERNCLCLVKPHPMAVKYDGLDSLSNLLFIDDKWISDKGITLYELVGCTDILISDISSIVIDYLLTDQPIICVSADFEEYRKSRGFYFDDIENWLPGPVLKTMASFYMSLDVVLTTDQDPYKQKRKALKDAFFTYQDAYSTKRLVEYVLRSDNMSHFLKDGDNHHVTNTISKDRIYVDVENNRC